MDIIQLIHNGYLILLAVRLLDLGIIARKGTLEFLFIAILTIGLWW